MSRIPIPISKADLEQYEGRLVLVTAQALAKVDATGWEKLAQSTRSRWLDRSLDLLASVLADRAVVERLPLLAKSLSWRIRDKTNANTEESVVFHYRGGVYVSPCSRGWTLTDFQPGGARGLEDVLDQGDYAAEIRVIRKSDPKCSCVDTQGESVGTDRNHLICLFPPRSLLVRSMQKTSVILGESMSDKEWADHIDKIWNTNPELVAAAKSAKFTFLERQAIAAVHEQIQRNAEPDTFDKWCPWRKFSDLTLSAWLNYRGCGPVFIHKISALGWVRTEPTEKPLGARTSNALANCNLFSTVPPSKAEVKAAVISGKLLPGKWRNYGVVAHREVCEWLELPVSPAKTRKWKYDPYTGKPLS